MSTKVYDQAAQFRFLLQAEFMRRCEAIPGFSLRAFARQLSCDPTALSKYLSGKRKFTRKTIEKFSAKLQLKPSQTLDLLGESEQPKENYVQIEEDTFEVISNWYYLAILELTHIKSFKPDQQWVAKMLDLTPVQVNIAVETLVRVGLLEITPEGLWIDRYENFTARKTNYTNAAMRKMQRQVLEKALHALENIPVEHRSQTTMTLSVDSALLDEAKERISQFKKEMTAFLSGKGNEDSVFELTVSLFPVTKMEP